MIFRTNERLHLGFYCHLGDLHELLNFDHSSIFRLDQSYSFITAPLEGNNKAALKRLFSLLESKWLKSKANMMNSGWLICNWKLFLNIESFQKILLWQSIEVQLRCIPWIIQKAGRQGLTHQCLMKTVDNKVYYLKSTTKVWTRTNRTSFL